MQLPDYVKEILNTYHKAGFKAYVVGGCVRDHLLKRIPNDYDVATNAPVEATFSLFERVVATGLKHGTVTIHLEEPVEVTVFRIEGKYQDHRHPDSVQFVETIEEDLSRRDFTINAMAYNEQEGLIDPYLGQMDLKNRKIRCVGDPDTRFQEDALRMLRAFRFAAKLGFEIEEKTKASIEDNQTLIQYVSIERTRFELLEILKYDPYQIEKMIYLLEPIFPELKACKECEQNSIWHDTNVLHHSLRAVKLLEPFDETLAWAILMHDFGKPQTKTTKDGRDHFYGHPLLGKEISSCLCKRLKLSKYQQQWIPILIEFHDEPLHPSLKTIYRFCVQHRFTDAMMQQLFQIKRCDILAHSAKGKESIHKLDTFVDFYEMNKKNRPICFQDLKINGKDIVDNTNKQGKEIHEFLEQCLQECFYQPELNDREYWISRMRKK